MEERIVYVSRLTRLPLLGADGSEIGRINDAVIDLGSKPPRVHGFVVAMQRRRVFIGIGRIGEIGSDGARLRRGSVNTRNFELRGGERLIAGELLGKRFKGERVVDIGLRPTSDGQAWEVATVALAGGHRVPGLRRVPNVLDWSEAGELFAPERPVDRQAAELGNLHPAEMADAIRKLPLSRRRVLARELEDDRFADLLEELDEEDQVRLVEGLDSDRLARVLDEMEADDAADLLGEFTSVRQAELLRAMNPEEAEPVRRLLSYLPDTAGGLMTPEPVILSPDATVAEALARVRDPDLTPALSSLVLVVRPPTATPTGQYLGCVALQRLLREPPSMLVGGIVDADLPWLDPDTSLAMLTRYFAAYNLVCGPVVDAQHHLLGAVTVDDVLDHLLPHDWRDTTEEPSLGIARGMA